MKALKLAEVTPDKEVMVEEIRKVTKAATLEETYIKKPESKGKK